MKPGDRMLYISELDSNGLMVVTVKRVDDDMVFTEELEGYVFPDELLSREDVVGMFDAG